MHKRIIIPTYNDRHATCGWEFPFVHRDDVSVMWYHKDDNLQPGDVVECNDGYRIPNFGRSSYAFLHHIVQEYENLADVEIFTKTHLHRQKIDIVRTVERCHDYLHLQAFNGLRAFVYTSSDSDHEALMQSVTKNPGLFKADRTSPRNVTFLFNNARIELPGLKLSGADISDSPIAGLFYCHDLPEQSSELYHRALSYIFPEYSLPLPYCFRRENVWSVKKELILHHPKELYQSLIQKIESGDDVWSMCHDEWCQFWPLFWDETISRFQA